jgi:protein disulfide-isomerase
MKRFLIPSLLALLILPVGAVQIGNTLEQVLAEKGKPDNRLQAGATTILTYADQRIKLKNGKVAEIKDASDTSISGGSVKEIKEVAVPPTLVAGGEWTINPKDALKQAKLENKKVFLFFTGSDWCGWCKRLEAEILTTRQFKDYAAQKLVLVKLDFPRNIDLGDTVRNRNFQLAKKYNIEGYPTIIVLNSAGEQVGTLGYMEGGPAGFLQRLSAL